MNRATGAIVISLLMVSPSFSDDPTVIAPQRGWVGSVAFSPDGSWLAIGTGDSKVALWHMETKRISFTLDGDGSAVSALCWVPGKAKDGQILVAGTHKGTTRLIPTRNLREPTNDFSDITGHRGSVQCAIGLRGGESLITGGMDSTIRVNDIQIGRVKTTLQKHTSWVNGFSLSKDNSLLASAGSDNAVRLWNTKTWESKGEFTVKEGEVRSTALSPDGKLVAAGIRYGWVRVWDIGLRKEVFSTKAHEGESGGVAFTPDGKTLVSGGGDWNKPGEVRLFDTATWKTRATLKHTGEVLCLALSSDGRWLAAGSWDRTVRLWDLAKGK